MKQDVPIIPSKQYTSGEILIDADTIALRVKQLAQEIAGDYIHKELILVGILKGACLITSDLLRAVFDEGCKKTMVSFITIKSYSNETISHGPQLIHDIDFNPEGKDILLVDDIVDTGMSLHYVQNLLLQRKSASVRVFSLLSKPSRRKVHFEPDYTGFVVPNVWIEGYGMDTNELGRGNPNIIVGGTY